MWFKRLAFIILSDKRKYIASYLHIRCIQIYFCSVYQDLLKRYFTFCFCCFVVSKGVGWDTIKDFIKFVWFLIDINSYFSPGFFHSNLYIQKFHSLGCFLFQSLIIISFWCIAWNVSWKRRFFGKKIPWF